MESPRKLWFTHRRDGHFAAWGWAWIILGLGCFCAAGDQRETLARYEFQRPEMGMLFRLVLYAADSTNAARAADAAFQRIEQLNSIMSDYDAESELSRLSYTSGQGKEVVVSEDLWRVLSRAQELAERSGGAFDVTVGPYVNLWRRARRQHELPDPAKLAQAREAVGYQHVRLIPQRQAVQLLVPNMRLDLGGIGKGYAVDEALKVLRREGVHQALMEAGGDMGVSDPPPGKQAWRIQLSSVDATNAPPSRFLLLRNHALSTSGDLYQRLEIGGKRYSHIVDPHTGIGLTDHSVVNVIAPDSTTADSLTKVVSVLGPDKGLRFIAQVPGVEARTMREIGGKIEVSESSGFAQFYQSQQ